MTCECGLLRETFSVERCQECGTACCPSCGLVIETQTYCRWCAALGATAA